MEVTKHNFESVFPLITSSIESADFLGIYISIGTPLNLILSLDMCSVGRECGAPVGGYWWLLVGRQKITFGVYCTVFNPIRSH